MHVILKNHSQENLIQDFRTKRLEHVRTCDKRPSLRRIILPLLVLMKTVPLDIAVCPRSAPLVLHPPTVNVHQLDSLDDRAWHMSLQALDESWKTWSTWWGWWSW